MQTMGDRGALTTIAAMAQIAPCGYPELGAGRLTKFFHEGRTGEQHRPVTAQRVVSIVRSKPALSPPDRASNQRAFAI